MEELSGVRALGAKVGSDHRLTFGKLAAVDRPEPKAHYAFSRHRSCSLAYRFSGLPVAY